MKRIETTFDTFFKTISSVLMSFIKHLAKFIVPIPPSWYWMQVVSESSDSQVVGIFAAVVLEIGGMLAAHFAIAFYGTAKGKIAAILTGAYLVIGIGVMWLLESADLDSKLVITAIFIIAGMVYILSGMYEIEGQERKQIEDDKAWERGQIEKDRELERQLKVTDKQLKHEERLAKLTVTSQKRSTQAINERKAQQQHTDWRTIPREKRLEMADMTPKEIHETYPDITRRTAENWRNSARAIKAKVSQNGSL